MKIWLLSALICLFAISAMAAEGHAAAEGHKVHYRSGDETIDGFLYLPSGKGPFPALVVIHEWWGLTPWVKQQASDLAHQGYAALAIDLYRGKVATTADEAHEIMRGVPEDRANRDLLAATAYLRTLTTVDAKRMGSIGWCMGGGYAFDLAVLDPKLKVAVVNYGHLAADDATLKKIHASILGIFGGKDQGIPVADINKFESQMRALGKKVEIHIFPDAGHAFENSENKKGYREEDAKLARKYTANFLARNLKF